MTSSGPTILGFYRIFFRTGRNGLVIHSTLRQDESRKPRSNRPTASSLNAAAVGQTISNHVIMATAADGGVRLFTQTGTHFVVDISGWYL